MATDLATSQRFEPWHDRLVMIGQRLQRFYTTFNMASVLLAALSLAVLSFNQSHLMDSSLTRAAEGLFSSCALTSIISATTATMLLFRYEGCSPATWKELAIVWSPLVLLDLAVVEFLFGLVFCYAERNSLWRTSLLSAELAIMLGYCVWISVWMWATMSDAGGTSSEEGSTAAHKTQDTT